MGLSALLSGALKGVSWQKIAGLAVTYGPEIYRQACERLGKSGQPAAPPQAEIDLQERIDRLEQLLVEQEEVIRELVARNERLEETCLQLAGQVKKFRVVCASLAGITLVLAGVLLWPR
jgi:uncharacterized coiled-coil protein SlyX